jgi:hypothetical protein
MTQQGGTLPPPNPPDWGYAFYYGSLRWITVYFLVEYEILEQALADYGGVGFTPAKFTDQPDSGHEYGAVGLNPMAYGSHLQNLVEATTEAELNILAYPTIRAGDVPTLSFSDFLLGDEQTKTIGNYRVFVPCDDPFAVCAGRGMFGERKFVTTLPYSFPGTNSAAKEWTFQCCDPKPEYSSDLDCSAMPPLNPPPPQGLSDCGSDDSFIFKLVADLSGAPAVDGSTSPIVDYSTRKPCPDGMPDQGQCIERLNGPNDEKPSGSFRNVLGPLKTYIPMDGELGCVQVTTGSSDHPMKAAVDRLIGDRPCVAAQTFHSPSPVIESRPFWTG